MRLDQSELRMSIGDGRLMPSLLQLTQRGVLGLAWTDEDLVVEKTMGKLARWIPVGCRVCDEVAPFQGMEDQFHELKDDYCPSFALSKVGLNFEDADLGKVSIEVLWMPSITCFLIILRHSRQI